MCSLAVAKVNNKMKRAKLFHNTEDMVRQDKRYLRNLAIELNNVGADLQEIGESSQALELYKAAALTEMEAIDLQELSNDDVRENVVTNRVAKVKQGKDKLKLRSSTQTKAYDDDQNYENDCERIDISRTVFLSRPLKIAKHTDRPILAKSQEGSSYQYDVGSNNSAVILYNMGHIYYKQGKMKLAAQLFEKALVTEDTEDYPFGSLVFPLLFNNVGHIYFCLGKRHEASVAFLESWRLTQELEGFCDREPDAFSQSGSTFEDESERFVHRYIATVLYNNGVAYSVEEDYAEALDCFLDAWAYNNTESLALKIVANMNFIGSTHRKRGRNREALNAYNRAMETREQMIKIASCFPVKLYSTLLHGIGLVYYQAGKYRAAMQAFMLSFRLLKASFGNDDPRVKWMKTQLALVSKLVEMSCAAAAA